MIMTLIDVLNTNDRFANNAGAKLTFIGDGRATAVMTVTKEHLNAGGVCQGGRCLPLPTLRLLLL